MTYTRNNTKNFTEMFQVTSKPFGESESPTPKRYFDEEWPKEEEILAIGLKMSKLNKADRQKREKDSKYNTNNVKGK